MGLAFIRGKAVRPGMLKASLNVGHIRKYPTLVFEASVSICASKFRSKSRTFHYTRPKKITEFWPMKGLKRVAPIT